MQYFIGHYHYTIGLARALYLGSAVCLGLIHEQPSKIASLFCVQTANDYSQIIRPNLQHFSPDSPHRHPARCTADCRCPGCLRDQFLFPPTHFRIRQCQPYHLAFGNAFA